jgi:hypothetical protein
VSRAVVMPVRAQARTRRDNSQSLRPSILESLLSLYPNGALHVVHRHGQEVPPPDTG